MVAMLVVIMPISGFMQFGVLTGPGRKTREQFKTSLVLKAPIWEMT